MTQLLIVKTLIMTNLVKTCRSFFYVENRQMISYLKTESPEKIMLNRHNPKHKVNSIPHLFNSFNDGVLVTRVGENEIKMINMFSAERTKLESLACVKSIFNAAVFPSVNIIAAMLINGVHDLGLERQVREASYDVMVYGSMIDDYADCFGEELINQRQTNDISTGKQTWLLFKTLELASPEQRQRLEMNYGKDDDASIENVLQLFKELNIKQELLNLAEETYWKVRDKLNRLPQKEIPVNIAFGLLNHYRAVTQGVVARV